MVVGPPDGAGEWEIPMPPVGDPRDMLHEQSAFQMAADENNLFCGAMGGGPYSVHPDDTTGTVLGDAAIIAQFDAEVGKR